MGYTPTGIAVASADQSRISLDLAVKRVLACRPIFAKIIKEVVVGAARPRIHAPQRRPGKVWEPEKSVFYLYLFPYRADTGKLD